jgi:hypothetical protein
MSTVTGTYVPGHYRTAPNSTNRDNFSTKPNINPYTGEPGWIKPDNSAILNNSTPYINTPNLSNTSKSSGICNYSACKNPGKNFKAR